VEMTFWNENWKLGWARWTRGKQGENVNNQLLGMVDFGGGIWTKMHFSKNWQWQNERGQQFRDWMDKMGN
jgi:hypothetical protein